MPTIKSQTAITPRGVDIIAFADGKVVEVIKGAVVGNTVALHHAVNGRNFITRYQHMRDGVPVKVGDIVKKGQVIGVMGNTGECISSRTDIPMQYRGTHLHFGLKENSTFYNNGEWVDPMPYLMGIKTIDSKSATTSQETSVHYLVQVQANLNIRKGAGTSFAIADTIRDNGVYTIIAECDGAGAKKWGKLQNGRGAGLVLTILRGLVSPARR